MDVLVRRDSDRVEASEAGRAFELRTCSGSGPGVALDGGPKFNLAAFDPDYFERLRTRIEAAGRRGIYVSVMLFEGWGLMHGNRRRGVEEDGWAWRSHPFHPRNNIRSQNSRVSAGEERWG